MIDAHCHILPAIDDGSQSIRETIKIFSELRNFDIDKVVCTPHIKGHMGSLEVALNAYNRVLPFAKQNNIELVLGYEVSWRNVIEVGFKDIKKYRIGNSNFILLEFSMSHLTHNWESIIFNLQGWGLDVIIAHPERYLQIAQDISIAKKMHDMGCFLMLSSNFILRSWMDGKAKKCAKKLLDNNLIDLVCSDAHHLEDYNCLEKAFSFAQNYGWDFNRSQEILNTIFNK